MAGKLERTADTQEDCLYMKQCVKGSSRVTERALPQCEGMEAEESEDNRQSSPIQRTRATRQWGVLAGVHGVFTRAHAAAAWLASGASHPLWTRNAEVPPGEPRTTPA